MSDVTKKPVYYLHLPRSGGTSVFHNLEVNGLRVNVPNANGNPIDSSGDWYPFWSLPRDEQLSFLSACTIVYNEMTLGLNFFPEFFFYVVSVRKPCVHRVALTLYWAELRGYGAEYVCANFPKLLRECSESFPDNLLVRMLSGVRDSETPLTRMNFKVARDRFRYFKVLRTEFLADDFQSTFNLPYNADLGRHARTLTCDTAQLLDTYSEAVCRYIESDIELLEKIYS